MRTVASSALSWRANSLIFNGKVVAEIVRDAKYPSMWRVVTGGQTSDMVNIARARDAARALVLGQLNAEELPPPSPPVRQIMEAAE